MGLSAEKPISTNAPHGRSESRAQTHAQKPCRPQAPARAKKAPPLKLEVLNWNVRFANFLSRRGTPRRYVLRGKGEYDLNCRFPKGRPPSRTDSNFYRGPIFPVNGFQPRIQWIEDLRIMAFRHGQTAGLGGMAHLHPRICPTAGAGSSQREDSAAHRHHQRIPCRGICSDVACCVAL